MRRGIMVGALFAVGAVALPAVGYRGQPDEPKVITMQTMNVRENLYVLSGGGGNTVILVTADHGVVVVDPKRAGWGQTIQDAVGAITDQPVTTIINTHAHADHTGSNGEFPGGVRIIAHDNTKENMARMDAFKGDDARFLPNETFADALSLFEGKDRIDLYSFGAGHTNGDAIVVFPELGMAYLGDLMPAEAAPFIDVANGGSGVAYAETLAAAVTQIKGVRRVIPGHATPPAGSPIPTWITWEDVQEYARFNRDFLEAVRDANKSGQSVNQAVADLDQLGRYDNYDMAQAAENVQVIYDELQP